jgi:predicted Zn-dependent peptidase
MLAEWLPRGAGHRDASEILVELDALGVSHQQSASVTHISLSAAMLGSSLGPALEIMADMVLSPHLGEESFEPIQALALQSLQSLEDDPASLAMTHLRQRYFGDPWGRHAGGTPEGLQAIRTSDIRQAHSDLIQPEGAILAVAGSMNFSQLKDQVARLFGNWKAKPVPIPKNNPPRKLVEHLPKETNQCQITMAFPSVDIQAPDYYQARAALAILGGYSSARLFTEVREKRGLCYTVYAGYEAMYKQAAAVIYAGTGADRAQETLDVTLAELARLKRDGVTEDELDMMRAGLVSGLVMQQESSLSRSASLASDFYHLGRVRLIDEIRGALARLSADDVSQHAAGLDLENRTILTLGPQPLKIS